MSKYIVSANSDVSLNLSATDAEMFVLITECLAKFFKVDCPVETECHADEYLFHENEFCSLVEKVFENQRSWSYEWATHASALYEMVKGEMYDWVWRQDREPHLPFRPRRWKYDSPDNHCGKTIGQN